jgi:hypothetical protein
MLARPHMHVWNEIRQVTSSVIRILILPGNQSGGVKKEAFQAIDANADRLGRP